MKSKAIKVENVNAAASKLLVLKVIIATMLAFVLTNAKIFSSVSPFSVALIAALPTKFSVIGALSSIMGYIFFEKSKYSMFFIIAILAVTILKFVTFKLLKVKPTAFLATVLAFGTTLTISILRFVVGEMATVDFVLLITESILCGTFAYFYAIAARAIFARKAVSTYNKAQTASLAILAVSVIVALCGFSLFNINIGIIIGTVVIYVACSRYGIVGASVCSILMSVSFTMYSVELLTFCGLLIIASFVAGIFIEVNKVVQIAGFLAVMTVGLMILGAPVLLTYHIIEVFLATAIFILLPDKLLDYIKKATAQATGSDMALMLNSGVSTKLSFASQTIIDLQDDLEHVSQCFNKSSHIDINSVYDSAADVVCKNCTLNLNCWEKNYNDTVSTYPQMTAVLKKSGVISPRAMPAYFQENCCKLSDFTDKINVKYQSFVANESAKRHVNEARKIVVEQFQGIADMLCEVSAELSEFSSYDEVSCKLIKSTFTQLENEPEQVICTTDKYGRMYIEIYTVGNVKTQPSLLCETFSHVLGREFDLPSITSISRKSKLSFFEKANYTVDFSAGQISNNGNKICGDTYEFFQDSKGFAYMILSDGMGSGKRAAIDSVMTCSIILKLIKAGFGLESALKLINSSLLVKSSDESLATIDIAKIDLYTGKVEFLKAGAAASYVKLGGLTGKVDSNSLPAGILQGIKFEKKVVTIKSDDIILLVSDGCLCDGDDWILEQIKVNSHRTAKEISSRISYEAKKRMNELDTDDVTVLAAKICKGV
ncbi:MAG: SpoIIE family protein phosphatase [Oscillospiraceae bacterium]